MDHIVPVSKAKKSRKARQKLTIHGIKDVNNPKNLAPACVSCNQRKGNKMGLWYYRGVLGKYRFYWPAVYLLLAVLLILVVYSLLHTDFIRVLKKIIIE